MRKLAVLLLLVAATTADARRHGGRRLDRAIDRIDAIESRLDRMDRDAVRHELEELRHDLESLRDSDDAEPMSDDDFAKFLGALRSTSVTEEVTVVREQAQTSWFTVDQVKQVVQAVAANNEAQAAYAMYPRVVDRDSWVDVYAGMSASAERELHRLIGGP